jgi:hypothetical protein
MDAAGFSVFAQQTELGARGADLIYLTPEDNVLVLEVKGTLRAGTIPRLGRSRFKQTSAAWLDAANAPMLEWGLEAADVYGAVMVVDVAAACASVAATADYSVYVPVDDLGALDCQGSPEFPRPAHGNSPPWRVAESGAGGRGLTGCRVR